MESDELVPALVSRRLRTRLIGRKILYYPRLPSTMDAARRAALEGAPEGTVIIAGEQTTGRGRAGRTWVSPRGNIALSIVLGTDAASVHYLVMIAALAVKAAIAKVAGLKAQIKWPNDVLVNGKKCAGILIENEIRGGRLLSSVVGLGVNIKAPVLPPGADLPAGGLEEEGGLTISREGLIRHLLAEFERWYLKLPYGEEIFRAWKDSLVTIGKRVVVKWGDRVSEGIAEDVDAGGTLLLRKDDGALERVIAGEVSLREKQAGI